MIHLDSRCSVQNEENEHHAARQTSLTLQRGRSVGEGIAMSRPFGLVDSKVQEAEYFLERILKADRFFFGVRCDAVAFTAAMRSITFAMQSSQKGIPDFDAWYAKKQEQMRSDPLARFFNSFRRISQHIGDNAVIGGSSSEGNALFYFGLLPDLKEVPAIDVASACTAYFRSTLEMVYECYLRFATRINGQWYFTQDNFASLGKTIEDAEEELGLQRGWTQVSGYDDKTRWFYLRKQANGCNIQQEFVTWLGRRVPYPDDEDEGDRTSP